MTSLLSDGNFGVDFVLKYQNFISSFKVSCQFLVDYNVRVELYDIIDCLSHLNNASAPGCITVPETVDMEGPVRQATGVDAENLHASATNGSTHSALLYPFWPFP